MGTPPLWMMPERGCMTSPRSHSNRTHDFRELLLLFFLLCEFILECHCQSKSTNELGAGAGAEEKARHLRAPLFLWTPHCAVHKPQEAQGI